MTKKIQAVNAHVADEIAHAERTEQIEFIYQGLDWLSKQNLSLEAKKLVGELWDGITVVNSQADAFEKRAQRAELATIGALASADEFMQQRDNALDELSAYINAVRAGDHPDVQAVIEQARQEAFEEYQSNERRIIETAKRLTQKGA